LNPEGLFYNADVVLASSDNLQSMYMDQWKKFMGKNLTQDEIENKYLANYYEEDHPVKLTDHLSWLAEIGFVNIDVIWKYYSLAVYGGKKST